MCIVQKLNKPDAFHEDGIWLDANKDVSFTSFTSVDNECATYGTYSTDELCDDYVGSNASGVEEGK